jgi:hypothetical protein
MVRAVTTTPSDPSGAQPAWDSSAAWRELLDGLRDLDQTFLEGPKAVRGEQSVVEGYRFLASVLGVAFDIYLFSDTARPRFADINTPYRHDRAWGGDNTDAYYAFAPIDPRRTYRVSGTRGDSVYFSLTIYNEPSPGQWSDRVVGLVNDADLAFDEEGRFAFMIGPARPAGYDGAFIELTDDAAAAVTRDYQLYPDRGARVDWTIEAVDPPATYRYTDEHNAAAFRTALRWVQEMFAIVPLTVEPRQDETTLGHNAPVGANTCAAPYQVPDANYGWSARDACYSFGSFSLRADEALAITHRPPKCRFWSLMVWNPYMAGYNADYARTSINHGTAVPNSDGTVTTVIALDQLEHPNSISTIGHEEGVIAFRWFHAESVPDTPVVELVKVGDAPRAAS